MNERKKIHPAWWMLVGCILLQAGGTGILSNCQSVFYSSITGELGISNGAISLFSTMRTISTGATMFIMPVLLSRVNLRVLLSAMSIIGCGCFAMEGLFSDISQWYLMAIPFGITSGGLITMPATLVINNWFHKRAGLVLGIALASSGVAGAMVAPLCSSLILRLGWRPAIALIGLLALVLLLPATALILRLTPQEMGCAPYGEERSADGAVTRTVLRAENSPLANRMIVLVFCLLLAILPYGAQQMSYHYSLFAEQEGLGLVAAANFTSLCMVGNTLGKLLLGTLNDRKGAWVTTITAEAIIVLSMAIFGSGSGNVMLLYAAALLMGLSYSMAAMLPALLSRQVYAGQYQKRYSLLLGAGMVAGALLNLCIGVGSDLLGGYRVLFQISAVMNALAILIAALLNFLEKKVGPAKMETAVSSEKQ